MNKIEKYAATHRMIDLIGDNYSFLHVMNRFGLSLGFGSKTIKAVCEENNVDCNTFLTVINFIAGGSCRIDDTVDLSIPTLIDYLKNSHTYFLDFALPRIRERLVEATSGDEKSEIDFLIIQFFDNYMQEVHKHMTYEDDTVFKYVENLLEGNILDNYTITTYSKHHDLVNERLRELKNIILKYRTSKSNNSLMFAALFDIYSCDAELEAHCKVEDYIFTPAILELEKKIKENEK